MAVNSEGLLAVTDDTNWSVHLLSKDGAFVRSIGEGVLSRNLFGVAFDLKGNIWVTDVNNHKVVKLSKDGQLLHTIHHAGSKSDSFKSPVAVSVSTEGMIYICDRDHHRVTVHDEEGKFLFAFGSKGSGPRCFNKLRDIMIGSDGLVYVTDNLSKSICIWSKGGNFIRDFETKYAPTCIADTRDNHLVITSYSPTSFLSNPVMVYTLEGELVHEFGGYGSDPGRFNIPQGICVANDGLVYVADSRNKRVQVF